MALLLLLLLFKPSPALFDVRIAVNDCDWGNYMEEKLLLCTWGRSVKGYFLSIITLFVYLIGVYLLIKEALPNALAFSLFSWSYFLSLSAKVWLDSDAKSLYTELFLKVFTLYTFDYLNLFCIIAMAMSSYFGLPKLPKSTSL
jgi:hypothetical protein